MNVFLSTYESRLQAWYDLRNRVTNLDLEKQCVEIDDWWQQAPFVNHYLHSDFITQWPSPWDLLYANTYCQYARGLGMIYTLLLLGINDLAFVEATDDNNNEVILVLVGSAKYVLNYWPKSVLSTNFQDFAISRELNILPLKEKIGLT